MKAIIEITDLPQLKEGHDRIQVTLHFDPPMRPEESSTLASAKALEAVAYLANQVKEAGK